MQCLTYTASESKLRVEVVEWLYVKRMTKIWLADFTNIFLNLQIGAQKLNDTVSSDFI